MDEIYNWVFFAPILLLVAVLLAMLYFPRTYYENRNRFLSGEDYWIPFRKHNAPRFGRGPRPWRRIQKIFLSAEDYLKSDAGLEETVKQSLQARGLAWLDLAVQAKDKKLLLYGTVANEAQKQEIEAIAGSTPGVTKVESFLRVTLAPGEGRDSRTQAG